MKHCLECGKALSERVSGGLCSVCALRGALELQTSEPWLPDQRRTEPAPEAAFSPRRLGDYELLEEIAHGGMGVVYKARQLSLDRVVALKMIRAERLARPEVVRRFRHEAAAAARLQHPNIVAIHEAGECDGQQYYSMDFIEGRSLAELVRQHPLAPRQAAAYVQAIAEAIHYAHQCGILHRDLKPSNILIDATDTPRVADFGLAKVLQSEPDMTLTGEIIGSPSYMAPEQTGGQKAQIDARTDVYALGAILYELLSGRPPFKADTSLATLKLVAENEPVAPRLLNPGLPQDLETICLKCLEKEPRRRYATAQDLANELGRFLRGEPILARPLAMPARAWRCCRRHPLRSALVAALVLVVLCGTSAVLWELNATAAARRRAENAERNLTEQLWASHLAEARANRLSGRAGRRFDSLAALGKAAAIRSALELRNEAIACLALPDVRVQRWIRSDPRTNYIAFALDDQFERYACINEDSSLGIGRLSDNCELKRFAGLGKAERSTLRFSRNGQFLAQGAEVGTKGYFVLWDLASERLALTNSMYVRGMDFAPGDKQLAVVEAYKGIVHFYDLASCAETTNFTLPPTLNHVAYDPAGKRLAISRDQDPPVLILELATWATSTALKGAGSIGYVAWSPDGKTLACPSSDRQVYLLRVETGEWEVLQGHEDACTATLFNHQGDVLVSFGWDGTTRFWDATHSELLVTVSGGWIQNGFAPDDRRLGFGFSAYELGIWEVEPAMECRRFGRTGKLWGAQFAPDGLTLASGSSDGVRLWDLKGNRLVQHLPLSEVRSVVWHPNGRALLASGSSRLERWTVRVSNAAPGAWLHSPELLSSRCREAACLGSDGRTLVVANTDSADLLVFDLEHPDAAPKPLTGHARANFVAISPNGKWIATGTWQGTGVKIWSTETWQPFKELPVPGNATCTFSPDGLWLVTGSAHEYRFWKTGSWEPGLALPRQHAFDMYGSMTFSPDSRMLALLHGRSRPLKIISVPEGEELATIDTGQPLCFSADGTLLATVGGAKETLIVWNLREIRRQLAALKLDW